MKQNILFASATPGNDDVPCLGGFAMRWALFGVLLWWMSPYVLRGGGGSQGFMWLLGIAMGFALVRREFCR